MHHGFVGRDRPISSMFVVPYTVERRTNGIFGLLCCVGQHRQHTAERRTSCILGLPCSVGGDDNYISAAAPDSNMCKFSPEGRGEIVSVYLLRILGLCLSLLHVSFSLNVDGSITSSSSFEFLTKFCFEPGDQGDENGFQYTMTFPNNSKLALLVYFREEGDGTTAENSDLLQPWTCQERLSKSKNIFYLNPSAEQRSANAPKKFPVSEVGNDPIRNLPRVTAKGYIYFASSRRRWYYFTLANCLSYELCDPHTQFCEGNIRVDYSVVMTNAKQGAGKHFSADQFGIFSTYLVFFTIYCLLGIWLSWLVRQLMRQRFYHYTGWLLTGTVILQFLALACHVANTASVQDTGYEIPFFRVAAIFFGACSEMSTLLLLILIAKGWTVVRRKISATSRVKIGVFFSLYFAIYMGTLGSYETMTTNVRQINIVYLYDSTFGDVLLGLRAFGVFWFSHTLLQTQQKFLDRRDFFRTLHIGAIAWLISLPLVVLIARFALADWYRSLTVTVCELVTHFLMHIFLMFLWRPQEYSKLFPYNRQTLEMNQRHTSYILQASDKNSSSIRVRKPPPRKPKSDMDLFDEQIEQRRTSSKLPGRSSITGGKPAQLEHPYPRIRKTIGNLREKLNYLYRYSDDLEKAMDELDDEDQDESFSPRVMLPAGKPPDEGNGGVLGAFKSSSYSSSPTAKKAEKNEEAESTTTSDGK